MYTGFIAMEPEPYFPELTPHYNKTTLRAYGLEITELESLVTKLEPALEGLV